MYIADIGTDSAPGCVGIIEALLMALTFETARILGFEPPRVEHRLDCPSVPEGLILRTVCAVAADLILAQ